MTGLCAYIQTAAGGQALRASVAAALPPARTASGAFGGFFYFMGFYAFWKGSA
ncbi:MAG: hypothetical protein LBT40_10010 [Deltaproteobacteria bacterium]|jgi:hypothetical protein|nr:hypothetical protein [Deltaproteobacteria bacterium]